jgi:hypothetical protein
MFRGLPQFERRYTLVGLRPEPPPFDWAAFWDFLQKASLVVGLVVALRQLSE